MGEAKPQRCPACDADRIDEGTAICVHFRDGLDRLSPRCIHPNSLARMIVEIAVDEGLIDSILDDGAEPHA